VKRSVPLDKLEEDLGRRIGEGETIEYEGRTWKVLIYSHTRNLVLLES